MSFENLKAGIDLGLPLPEDLQRLEEWLEQDDAPGDFDNMPV